MAGIFWVYGLENFCWDAEFMLNRKITHFWRFSWLIITPLLLIVIFIYTMVKLENPTYMNLQYPTTALVAGWVIFAVGALQVLLWGGWMILQDPNKSEALATLFRPDPEWGPKSPRVFKAWKDYKREKLEKRRLQSQGHSPMKKFFWILLGKYY